MRRIHIKTLASPIDYWCVNGPNCIRNNILITYLKKLDFEPIATNYFVFINNIIIISIYVNDILLTKFNKKKI